MNDNDKLIELHNAGLEPKHFGVDGHRYIVMAMNYLYSKQLKSSPLDILESITSETGRKAIEELGGLEYLSLIEEAHVPKENLPFFINKVKQDYTRRSLLRISDDIIVFAKSEEAEVLNPSELVSFASNKINDLNIDTEVNEDVYKMGDDTEAVLNERAESPSVVPGLEVGWTQYDRLTNGAQPGDLIVVVAESKTGKSVTLNNWGTKLGIKDKLPVLYFDTEMSGREQEDRTLSILSGIPHDEIVSGMYVMDTHNGTAKDKCEALKKAREELKSGSFFHIYMPHFDINKVTAIAKKFQVQFGIVAVFFDYIKIPSSQSMSRNMQEYQALGFFTSGLKDLAGTLKIPVFTAAQANRSDLGSGNKDASSIGGSYRILQLASKLMFLTNKSDEQIAKDGFQNGNQTLQIKYQRNGASDCDPINIMFDRPRITQREI